MSRITESLYRVTGVQLNEDHSGYVGHLSTEQMRDFLSKHTQLNNEQLAWWSRDKLQDFIEDVEDWSEKDLEDLVNYDKETELEEARSMFNAGDTTEEKMQTAIYNAIAKVLQEYDCLNIAETDLEKVLYDFLTEFYM